MTGQDENRDPHRLAVAVHEMGHAAVWHALGLRVVSIKVKGHGPHGSHGFVQLDGHKNITPAEARAYLVGMLAGRAADIVWSDDTGHPYDERGSSADLDNFRKYRKDAWTRHISDHEFRATTRRLVRQHWTKILRLAPRLAERGTLAPSAL